MKKYIAGTLAIAIAIVAFSFTLPSSTKFDCSEELHYFKVSSNFTDCNQAANSLSFPIADANEEFKTQSALPFGCQNLATQVCAVGYRSNQVIFNPATQTWTLAPGVSKTDYICCVKRTINQ